jgi:hypothetical protein
MPNPILGTQLWQHTLGTPIEVHYVNSQTGWWRREGPPPFRLGDIIRLRKTDMDDFVRKTSGNYPPLPSILERRKQLIPVQSVHVVTPKALP